jgi:hypothetical protein
MRTTQSSRAIALAALALTACSSSYTPQARGRVAVTMRGGQIAYVRDGQVHEHGFMGSGLVDAVEGNPAAMQAANEYRDRLKYGLLGILGGMACSIGGVAYAATQTQTDGDGGPRELNGRGQTGLIVALGCMVVMIVGAGYLGTAEPYRWDAINLFNDTQPMPLPGAPGYGYSAAKTSLKMRD